ncbi:hypothetical protein GNF83_19345 [Clostridium perfringens]|uniref:Uncharacterized protein n=1 Tax=Clostridium perfringens TaxID=1502 RepID=A0AAW9KQ60_CLOPF|nr:hypothetical protein [Clostridium perfringens]
MPTKVMFDFVCKPVGGQLCTSDETTDSRWVEKEIVLDMIESPAIRTRYQAYVEFDGNVRYLEYKTKPEFELKLDRTV